MVCMVSGVCFREADTYMLYPLMFNCRGGGCMFCVPSLWLLLGCVDIALMRIMYFSVSRCLSLFATAH